MINEQYTIDRIINEWQNWLDNNKIAKRVGLTELNKHIQNVVNEYDYKFLEKSINIITTKGKTVYRLPEFASFILSKPTIKDSSYTQISYIDKSEADYHIENRNTDYVELMWLGETTKIQNDIIDKANKLTITKASNFIAATLSIIGISPDNQVITEDIELLDTENSIESVNQYIMLESASLSVEQDEDLIITAGTVTTKIEAGNVDIESKVNIGFKGSKLKFASSEADEDITMFLKGIYENEELQETITINASVPEPESVNTYVDVLECYKFENSKGTITVTEVENPTNEILVLPKNKDSYSAKKLHIYPCNDIYNVCITVKRKLPVYKNTDYVIDMPAEYVPGVVIYGGLLNMLAKDKSVTQNTINKLMNDFYVAKKNMQFNELEISKTYEIKSGFEGFDFGIPSYYNNRWT
jgi:hypothetical protein